MPYTYERIEQRVYVDSVENKGRCLFTNREREAGDVILIEAPLLIATHTLCPTLWKALDEMHKADSYTLGSFTFHYAALCSAWFLDDRGLEVILDKFVPDGENEMIDKDTKKICQEIDSALHKSARSEFPSILRRNVDVRLLQRLVNSWRYNSFGHHTEEGLVLYNRISMCSHSCDPVCCWTYGEGDSFVLRARNSLAADEELTISYLQDDDLLKSTEVRRKKLENWKFSCACNRCMEKIDLCRGFRCLKCRVGAYYTMENVDPVPALGDVTADKLEKPLTNCDVCGHNVKGKHDLTKGSVYGMEAEYINRVEAYQGLEKSEINVTDVEWVYNGAVDFLHEYHWVVYWLDNYLWEHFRSGAGQPSPENVILHGERRVAYHGKVYPKPTFIWAWGLEDVGDQLEKLHKSCGSR